MSAGSELVLIGAPLKLCISFVSSSVLFSLLCCLLHQQTLVLCSPSVSMPLRPKRYKSLLNPTSIDFPVLLIDRFCMFVHVFWD